MVRIIAEIAMAFEGNPALSEMLVQAAAKTGADAVKFQVVFANELLVPSHPLWQLYSEAEMDISVWTSLRNAARENGIKFFLDVFGKRSLEIARNIGADGLKLHASDFFDRRLLRGALDACSQVFVSVAGVMKSEIDDLLSELGSDAGRVVLMTGFQAAPTPVNKSHVSRVAAFRAAYPTQSVGYMDHIPGESPDGIHVSALALAFGAQWIEKHMTLSRFCHRTDWMSSLDPHEFKEFVDAIRRCETALGAGNFELDEDEISYRNRTIKRYVAARTLTEGEILRDSDINALRSPDLGPGEGFHHAHDLIGRRMTRGLEAFTPFRSGDVE